MTLLEHPQLLRLAATLLLDIPVRRRIEAIGDLALLGVPPDSPAAEHLAELMKIAPHSDGVPLDAQIRAALHLGLGQLADAAQSETGQWCQPSGEPSADEVAAMGEIIEQREGSRRPC